MVFMHHYLLLRFAVLLSRCIIELLLPVFSTPLCQRPDRIFYVAAVLSLLMFLWDVLDSHTFRRVLYHLWCCSKPLEFCCLTHHVPTIARFRRIHDMWYIYVLGEMKICIWKFFVYYTSSYPPPIGSISLVHTAFLWADMRLKSGIYLLDDVMNAASVEKRQSRSFSFAPRASAKIARYWEYRT